MKFMDMICNFQEEEVTQEYIDEDKRKGARERRLWVLNLLTDDQRKELRKREFLTYTRRNKASVPSSQPSTPPQPEETTPSPSTEKVVLPLPPLVHELLPKTTPTENKIQLNIDVATMFGKFNMTVPVIEM
jgi:hypothetical protein